MRPPERNPFEFCLCLILAFSIWKVALGIDPLPNSLAESPDLFGRGSAAALLLGSVLVVVGFVWRDRFSGLLVEAVACLFLGVGSVCYGTALGFASDWASNAAIAIGLTYGLAAGGVARYVQVTRFLRSLERHA